jgi:autotransporter-associated beta strand protein
MNTISKLFPLACVLALFIPATSLFAADGHWISTESGQHWENQDHWANGIAAGEAGCTAYFNSDIDGTVFDVRIEQNRMIGNLFFCDPVGQTTWRLKTIGEDVLTLVAKPNEMPLITVKEPDDTAVIQICLGGSGGLCKAGKGRLVFGADGVVNGYSGDTVITSGRVSLGGAGAPGKGNTGYGIPRSSTVVFDNDANARLVLNGFNATIGGLSSRGGTGLKIVEAAYDTGVDKPAVLTLNVAENATMEYDGYLRDGGKGTTQLSVIKIGTGTQILSSPAAGRVAYSGRTVVSEGTLLINTLADITGGMTVENGAAIGGIGLINCNVVFNEGARFRFCPDAVLTVHGDKVDLGTLCVDDLDGLGDDIEPGSYTLMNGSAVFNAARLSESKVRIGRKKYARLEVGHDVKLFVFQK